jgi:hypothetical protein
VFFARELGYETVAVADAIKEMDLCKAMRARMHFGLIGRHME